MKVTRNKVVMSVIPAEINKLITQILLCAIAQ